MLTEIQYPYIVENENKVPIIAGTRMKVTQLISEKLAYGWSPEEIHFQHPELTLSQIYSALAYYADNEEYINDLIAAELKFIDDTFKNRTSKLAQRLRKEGLL